MKKIKIAFSDFWGGFEYNPTGKSNFDNVFYRILSERFDLEISNNPDLLIFSVFGQNHTQFKGKKVFYTGENIRPNYNTCDYSISFDYMDDPRNLRFPLSAISLYENNIVDFPPPDFEKIRREKTEFCNFVFSNPNAHLRNNLFSKLSQYKRVDSGGKAYNNIGYFVGDKLDFLNRYKFTIAFENSEFPGYTTEKLVHPKIVNSIPIYWGNPEVHRDWNTSSFINAYDFNNLDQLIEFIVKVDNDDDLWVSMIKESHFNQIKSRDLQHTSLLDFMEDIIKSFE